ncbi:MAG: hypothetical protein JWO80_5891 [Bryobacterales bacterium]|nr:hypothetical protein [Bryobacterales bacterium]
MTNDIIPRLYAALPQAKTWIDQYIADRVARARPVSSLGSSRLAACFPQEFLDKSKIVPVARVTFPPVETFGLPEFADIHLIEFEGITFKDTIFIRRDLSYEGLYFHELVHVVQWARLGVDNLLLAYGLALSRQSYRDTPLEDMAYRLQAKFEAGTLQGDVIEHIERLTDEVWAHGQQFLSVPSGWAR